MLSHDFPCLQSRCFVALCGDWLHEVLLGHTRERSAELEVPDEGDLRREGPVGVLVIRRRGATAVATRRHHHLRKQRLERVSDQNTLTYTGKYLKRT